MPLILMPAYHQDTKDTTGTVSRIAKAAPIKAARPPQRIRFADTLSPSLFFSITWQVRLAGLAHPFLTRGRTLSVSSRDPPAEPAHSEGV